MIHKAKKSLGQNFLKSKGVLLAMCKAGDLFKSDVVLEIGPGKGVLTEYLLRSVNKVIAIEKDHNLCEILFEKFQKEITSGHLVLIKGDILEFDPSVYDLKSGEYKVVANIPYNITGAIFKKFLTEDTQPSTMVLLVQKEVAERIVARDGKESILSVSVKAYGTPKYITKVSKKFFSPAPKVDSAIVQITSISKKNFASPLAPLRGTREGKIQEKWFFQIVKAGFAHKRKVLIRNLDAVVEKKKIKEFFEKNNINEKVRAEDISIKEWLALAKELE
ncbi:ribosomal RNA small subunit methyltransferase A [Candidatus Nomurabacteria bacterium]|nr:ribosomal RNA small subunit methyltransferase A [Candidatus Nomurabacteria bacterium]